MIQFFYGAGRDFVDVTGDVLSKCMHNDFIYIPAGDTGSAFFPDPLPGVAKKIIVVRDSNGVSTAQYYGPNEVIGVFLNDGPREIVAPPRSFAPDLKLAFVHEQLDFAGGDLNWERPEQLNTAEFLEPDAKVLELGSGRGTNTMMIASILDDESSFVTLECGGTEAVHRNRDANRFRFHIENAALSYRKLMYNPQLALTVPGDDLRDGFEWINTMTFEEIETKYGIRFDTLVVDCEGALYYVLQDHENLLENIRTIILESDYRSSEQKFAVEQIFSRFGFVKVKSLAIEIGAYDLPQECRDSFWEVWKR